MITKDIALKLEESIKNIGGTVDESMPYMDNYCHQIQFKINVWSLYYRTEIVWFSIGFIVGVIL